MSHVGVCHGTRLCVNSRAHDTHALLVSYGFVKERGVTCAVLFHFCGGIFFMLPLQDYLQSSWIQYLGCTVLFGFVCSTLI